MGGGEADAKEISMDTPAVEVLAELGGIFTFKKKKKKYQ